MLILQAIWFMLPAYVANMAPLLAKPFFQELAIPIDGGKTYRGQPLFGKSKTYRGVLAAVVLSTIIFLLQKYLFLYPFFQRISMLNYPQETLWLGFFFGLGAMAGDLVKSFFKRRMGLKSGDPWFPFDQLDYPMGAMIFALPFIILPTSLVLTILLITPLLSYAVNYLGYRLGLKEVQW